MQTTNTFHFEIYIRCTEWLILSSAAVEDEASCWTTAKASAQQEKRKRRMKMMVSRFSRQSHSSQHCSIACAHSPGRWMQMTCEATEPDDCQTNPRLNPAQHRAAQASERLTRTHQASGRRFTIRRGIHLQGLVLIRVLYIKMHVSKSLGIISPCMRAAKTRESQSSVLLFCQEFTLFPNWSLERWSWNSVQHIFSLKDWRLINIFSNNRRISETMSRSSLGRDDDTFGGISSPLWTRSVSRDTSDADTLFSEASTPFGTLPRGTE